MNKELPVIDLEKLQELLQFDIENKDDLVPELYKIFKQNAPDRVREISDALSKQDWTSIGREAHTLKSSSGNLGAARVSAICKDLELSVKNPDPGIVSEQVEILRRQLNVAMIELSILLGLKYAKSA